MRALCALLLIGVAGCANLQTGSCVTPASRRMTVTEMFFGRDIPGRAPLTEKEWSAFVALTITKEFPDGFTVLDGDGYWLDPRTNAPAREGAKILIAAAVPSDGLAARIERISDAYKTDFHQESVGVLAYRACGNFQ
ncbi:MAG TPA: DUF3574 domain-containing protein [Rhizomicrobium sp.]